MSTPSTELERRDDEAPGLPSFMPVQNAITDDAMSMLWREAKALAAGRMFKNVTQAEQAFAKLVVGHHLGVSPATAMTAIDIVEGAPQFRGTLLGTLVRSREGYDWKVLKHDETECSIEFFRGEESEGISTFTLAHAKRAELIQDFKVEEDGTVTVTAKKDNWRKYPRNMLWNRAMSNGVKQLVPETMAGIPVYGEGELTEGRRESAEGERAPTPVADPEAFKDAILEHVPDKLMKRAFLLLSGMNDLAPNSWTASKIEMVFKGKSEKDAVKELDAVDKAITELRERGAAAAAVGAEADEEVTDAEVVDETEPQAGADSGASDEQAKPEPLDPETGRTPDHESKLVRIADLEDQLREGDLSEQQASDAQAEIDSLEAEIPADVGPGQAALEL